MGKSTIDRGLDLATLGIMAGGAYLAWKFLSGEGGLTDPSWWNKDYVGGQLNVSVDTWLGAPFLKISNGTDSTVSVNMVSSVIKSDERDWYDLNDWEVEIPKGETKGTFLTFDPRLTDEKLGFKDSVPAHSGRDWGLFVRLEDQQGNPIPNPRREDGGWWFPNIYVKGEPQSEDEPSPGSGPTPSEPTGDDSKVDIEPFGGPWSYARSGFRVPRPNTYFTFQNMTGVKLRDVNLVVTYVGTGNRMYPCAHQAMSYLGANELRKLRVWPIDGINAIQASGMEAGLYDIVITMSGRKEFTSETVFSDQLFYGILEITE